MQNQSFWLGAMSALAVVFFALFVGVVTNKVSFDGGSVKKGAPARVVEQPTHDQGAPTEPAEIVVEGISDTDWVRGNRDAAVTIVEFSDIDCPFCNRFHATMNELLAEYDGKINWVYRDFPLDALHPQARDKAIAAECVGKLAGNDAYWTFLDGIFVGTAADEIAVEATKLGINAAALAACQEDPEIAAHVAADEAAGAAAGAAGTPYSVILTGDRTIPVNGAVPAAQLRTLIDGALES